MIWVSLAIAAWFTLGMLALWAARRQACDADAALDEPVPYWPSGGGDCTWCKPQPRGLCTCTGVCGYIRCIGDHTTLATLTAADMRMLDKWIREGHE